MKVYIKSFTVYADKTVCNIISPTGSIEMAVTIKNIKIKELKQFGEDLEKHIEKEILEFTNNNKR